MKKVTNLILLAIIATACNTSDQEFDATGTFEADETIVSAEGNGKLIQFSIEEGQMLKPNHIIGYIDTMQLHLKKKQLEYSINALLAQKPDVTKQLSSIQEQIDFTNHEKERFERLLKEDAATQKQVDDLTSQQELLQRQYNALKSSLLISTNSINKETLPLEAQIDQLEDQIKKSLIVSTMNGIVLAKYAEQGELAFTGKALFKMADLSTITLRAYISGSQLPELKLRQPVRIMVDSNNNQFKEFRGKISWISDKAEFTPKTIMTKEERANLVYAIKISVPNDGTLKIGMYGEVLFQ